MHIHKESRTPHKWPLHCFYIHTFCLGPNYICAGLPSGTSWVHCYKIPCPAGVSWGHPQSPIQATLNPFSLQQVVLLQRLCIIKGCPTTNGKCHLTYKTQGLSHSGIAPTRQSALQLKAVFLRPQTSSRHPALTAGSPLGGGGEVCVPKHFHPRPQTNLFSKSK